MIDQHRPQANGSPTLLTLALDEKNHGIQGRIATVFPCVSLGACTRISGRRLDKRTGSK